MTKQQNETMLKLFTTAYCVVKHNFSLMSFAVLFRLQERNGLSLGSAYQNYKAATDFVTCIAATYQKVFVE